MKTLPDPCGPDCRGMSPYHEEPCPKCGNWTERKVEVVSAFIVRGGRVLLQQRSPHRDYAMTWESPGGKIESSDPTPRHALIRELHEELGWQSDNSFDGIIDLDPCFVTVLDRPEFPKPARLSFYCTTPWPSWQPKMLDAVGIGWFTLREMGSLTLAPGNVRMYEALLGIGLERMVSTHAPR